jgi:hypothetical protein
MGESIYYIQDTRSVVGNCMLLWNPCRGGYTCDLRQAGKYTREEAEQIVRSRGTDVAWPVDYLDSIAVSHVRADAGLDPRMKVPL